jgi:carbon-monoxide dehydrogenase medium subunit
MTASPANDSIPALVVLGAEVVLISKNGERKIPITEFITGVRKTIREENEFLKEIQIPIQASEIRSTFQKLGLRKAQAISLVNCAILVKLKGSFIEEIRISSGSVSPKPNRLYEVEQYLLNKDIRAFTINIDEMKLPEISPISDIRSSGEYREDMVKTLIKRGLEDLRNPVSKTLSPRPVTLEGEDQNDDAGMSLPSSIEFAEEILISTEVNGKQYLLKTNTDKTLLDLVREDLHLTGTKEGCGEGECGACTMFLDGKAVMACLVPASRAHLAKIVTIEGVSTSDNLHPVQEAFVKEGAVQCGYCTPGFVMSTVKLLEEKPRPTTEEIKTAISGNLCRCTGYYKIVSAIEKVVSSTGD